MPVMDGPIFNRLQLGTAFYDEVTPYFPRLSRTCTHIHDVVHVRTYNLHVNLCMYVKAVGNRPVLRPKISFRAVAG